ncbi:ferredoxin [Dietzia sp. UBA5065]|uniref:ferredoxin n=1 Tax=Dietzia sp. UBA5065 TaxID=1946422 RepID=UPI0025B8018C|nr:ferredoxin [Dietzia sp. UBA5065]
MEIRVTDDCDGYGRCADLAPEVFSVPEEPDYQTTVLRPTIDEEAEEELAARAIAAIQQCPKRALVTDLDVRF